MYYELPRMPVQAHNSSGPQGDRLDALKNDSSSSAIALHPQLAVYLQTLDEHRKKCELSGRYGEAAAAASRIVELRASEAHRLKEVLLETQQQELAVLHERFQQESLACDTRWRSRVAEFEASIASQLTALKQQHELQLTELLVRCEAQRPSRPQHSAEILNGRKIEETLVKQGQYRKAHEVKVSTDALYNAEAAATQQAWELQVELRRSKQAAKQQSELEAFLARAARGRNELELRRVDETDKRQNRFRAQVQEVDAMHRVEMLHLQAYAESGQAGSSPYVPLRDSKFKRKRELLGLPCD